MIEAAGLRVFVAPDACLAISQLCVKLSDW